MYYATYEEANVWGFSTAAERDAWIEAAPERHMRPCEAISAKEARHIATYASYVALWGEDSLSNAPKWIREHIARNCTERQNWDAEYLWDDEEGAYLFPSDWHRAY